MYKKNPDLRSVIHMHPEHAVLLTICNKEILPIIGAYGQGARLAVEGVPTYPRSLTITNDESGQEFANFMGEKKVAMMHGHGITVVGSSIEDATVRTLAFDQLTTMMYKAYLLGEPRKISEEDIASLNQPPETNRRRGSAGGHAGMLATWRYYKTLAGEGESP
jgi:L-fuculose-phosphate aldolase